VVLVVAVVMQVRTATNQISMAQPPQPIIPPSNNRNNNLTGTVQLLTPRNNRNTNLTGTVQLLTPRNPYIPPVEPLFHTSNRRTQLTQILSIPFPFAVCVHVFVCEPSCEISKK